MSKRFKRLSSELHLRTAALYERTVLVFIGAELIGSGKIADITGDSVVIKGERYLRTNCTFCYA